MIGQEPRTEVVILLRSHAHVCTALAACIPVAGKETVLERLDVAVATMLTTTSLDSGETVATPVDPLLLSAVRQARVHSFLTN